MCNVENLLRILEINAETEEAQESEDEDEHDAGALGVDNGALADYVLGSPG